MAAGKNRKYDWDKLYEDWLHGSYINVTEFAKKHGIRLNTMYNYAYKNKWVEKKTQYSKRQAEEVTQAVIESNKDKAVRYNNEALSQCDSVNEVLSTYIKGVREGNIKFNPWAMEKIVACLDRLQKVQRLALGLDKQGVNSAAEDNVIKIMGALQEAIHESVD